MPRAEAIVLTLAPLGKARQASSLTEGRKGLVPPRQKLVDVALVTHVEDEMIPGTIKDPMHGHGQLHGTQVGGQVTAVLGDGLHQGLADLGTEGGNRLGRQGAQIGRGMNGGQVAVCHKRGCLGVMDVVHIAPSPFGDFII